MSHREDLREEVILWNNQFPLDRVYRKKYNIAFGSEAHRQLSQIDIYFDWLEDQLYAEYTENLKIDEEKRKKYEKGEWLSAREYKITEDEVLDLFDNIDITQF